MGQPLSSARRLEIVQARQSEGLSYQALATRYQVNYHTVRQLCLNYKEQGESALLPDYSACGRRITEASEKAYRLVRLVRHFHSGWGIPYILTRIEVAYPNLVLQSERTYQRRLKKAYPESILPPAKIPRENIVNDVRHAHDEWQVDANEKLKLISGQDYSYLNITDACSHALLQAKPFPPQGH